VYKFDTEDFLTRIKEEDDTMLKHLPILKKINEKGLLTTGSQAGSKYIGNYGVILERAYIDGFMPYKKAVSFLKKMNLNTDKNAVNVFISDNPKFFKSELDIPLTIHTKNDKTITETHMPLSIPINTLNMFKKEHKINKGENVLYIFCWDPVWNRDASTGLFADVLRNL
jgi:hypothetical protein